MNHKATIPPPDAALRRVLKHAKVTAFAQDADLRYGWIENPPEGWNSSNIIGKTELDVLPAKAAAFAAAAKRHVLRTGYAQWFDLAVEGTDGRGPRYFDLYVEPDRDSSGTVVGVAGVAVDVTDRRHQAATMDAVARDLSHRTKNLLAVIQSLGVQTARTSTSTEDFVETFRGRIQSISRSQDLSIAPNRQGAKCSDLIEAQVRPYLADIDRQIEFSGEDRYLTANGALHVGLALYELCVSAVQSGALSAPDSKILVTALINQRSAEAGPPYLELTWRESGGAVAPTLEGFSQLLLERVVPAAVGGRATMTVTASGRCYALTISDTDFE